MHFANPRPGIIIYFFVYATFIIASMDIHLSKSAIIGNIIVYGCEKYNCLMVVENVFSKYRDNIDRFRGSVPSNNIIELLNKTDIPFPSMCKIAGLFLISIDKTALTETQGLIADLGIEKFSAIIDALPSPARTGILYEIRECAPFIETPEDIKLFAEMANEDKPLTLDNFLKRKG